MGYGYFKGCTDHCHRAKRSFLMMPSSGEGKAPCRAAIAWRTPQGPNLHTPENLHTVS